MWAGKQLPAPLGTAPVQTCSAACRAAPGSSCRLSGPVQSTARAGDTAPSPGKSTSDPPMLSGFAPPWFRCFIDLFLISQWLDGDLCPPAARSWQRQPVTRARVAVCPWLGWHHVQNVCHMKVRRSRGRVSALQLLPEAQGHPSALGETLWVPLCFCSHLGSSGGGGVIPQGQHCQCMYPLGDVPSVVVPQEPT